MSHVHSPSPAASILHVITGLGDGGAEAVLYRLCIADRHRVHRVVSLMEDGKYGPLLRQAGVKVCCLGMPQGRLTLTGLWRLWRLLRSEPPALVQTWMYHADLVGGVLARLAGVRRVFWGVHHSTLQPGKSRRSTLLVARLNALLSRWVPAGIVCCAETAAAVHRSLGYAAARITVIPNGYELERFKPDPLARQRLRAQWGEGALIGMVGRFDPQKDHDNLLHALALVRRSDPGVRCVLVGRGLDEANAVLLALLERHGLHGQVLLLGQRDDVPAVMNALDLHVLSSLSEAFPNVLAEAMACGTPCVTTDVGDAGLIVGDTGWVVPPADAHALAQAILAALQMRTAAADAWQRRRNAARSRVATRFGLERMVSNYHAVWNDGPGAR